jgi:hypothetical protein
MDAVARAATGIVWMPNMPNSHVGTVVASFTFTAFTGLPLPQVVPAGSIELRQTVETVVVTAPRVELAFMSPPEQL